MEALRESFVFHFEYIEDVPEELQAQYAMYAINYARYGIEPELTDWRDIKMWNKAKERMDGEFQKYEKKCQNLKQNRVETESRPSRDRIDTESETENEKSAGDTVSVTDTVTEYESENESEAPKVPVTESPSQIAYSKKIFEIFKDAGLPCANNNEISFLMRDFKNGMAYLHKTPGLSTLHSNDVIKACENYAKTVNSGTSYMTGRYSFDRFVTFKNFADFLPGNFYPENFVKRGALGEAPKQELTWYEKCPECGKNQLRWDNNAQKYICDQCGKTYTYEEVHK